VGRGLWWRLLQSILNYQIETHVHGRGHDEKYKYSEMQYQNIDNQDVRNYIQKTHMERNKNPIYDYYMDAEKENRDTQKYAKNDNQETVEINNQTESDGQEQE
jgi:hypothetical protein